MSPLTVLDFAPSVPYPFLTENPFEIRVLIYACAAFLALVSFWGINSVHPGRKQFG
jgi:hypothetical protein